MIEYWESVLDLPDLNIYGTHQKLWSFFPNIQNGKRPFLFFKEGNCVIMRSSVCPKCKSFIRVFDYSDVKNCDLNVFVRCNPTFAESNGRGTRSKKRSIVDLEEIREWFLRKSKQHGFSIVSDVTIENNGPARWKKPNGRKCVVGSADIKGLIRITDKNLFGGMLISGIGRAKAFGFGMLIILDVLSDDNKE
jgi:CRISPR-associated protein Cas6/Cse3/CasE subtype I-E